jgi:hypothetical protein
MPCAHRKHGTREPKSFAIFVDHPSVLSTVFNDLLGNYVGIGEDAGIFGQFVFEPDEGGLVMSLL